MTPTNGLVALVLLGLTGCATLHGASSDLEGAVPIGSLTKKPAVNKADKVLAAAGYDGTAAEAPAEEPAEEESPLEEPPAEAPPAEEPAEEPAPEPPAAEPPAEEPVEAPPAPTPVRFVALGDAGLGNAEQYAVSAAIEQVCATNGCDFAIHLGDNIYDDGVSDVDDPQFQDKFEAPYANLDLPFYMVLGNHDWHQGEAGADAQIAYTARSSKWVLPDHYYTHVHGDVTFFALDTEPITDGDFAAQQAWLDQQLAAATTTWKIGMGHHPYVSNGDHGNAEGDFGPFFDQSLCGKVDVYFAGHDHDLQWLEPVCGTEMIGSGAGAKLRSVGGSNPTFFETSTLGFLWVEIVGDTFTGVFYDDQGNELFRRTVRK